MSDLPQRDESPSEPRRTEGVRRGGRSARVVESVLRATVEELGTVGYTALRVEDVAERSGVNKTSIYRRWPSKVELVAAALLNHARNHEAPDTGSLREDYLTVLRAMAARARHYTPELLHGLLAEMPELGVEFFSTLPDVIAQILRNAAARGEIPTADLPERVATLPLDLLRYEGLRRPGTWQALDEPTVERLFTEILDQIFLPLVTHRSDPAGTGERN